MAGGRPSHLFPQVRAVQSPGGKRSPEPCAQVRILLEAQLDSKFPNKMTDPDSPIDHTTEKCKVTSTFIDRRLWMLYLLQARSR